MRKFIITVNGKSYEVEVEELTAQSVGSVSTPSTQVAPAPAPQPAAGPKAEKAPQQKVDPQSLPGGAEVIKAPMPGTVLDVKVNTGDDVKKNQVLLVLEAMKMENEIMAPRDGKVVSIQVAKGSSVNADDSLIVLQ